MGKYYKISIIGSGNVAWHLAISLENFGHSIHEVYSRRVQNAQKLCDKLYQTSPKQDLDFTNSAAELIIIAVSDKAITEIIDGISVGPSTTLLHTSGTVSIDALTPVGNPCGVLYPIQTFSKSRMVDFKEIPFSIEGSGQQSLDFIHSLAETLSKKVYRHTTEQRRVIHLASVFAANFTNHMYTISKGLLESNGLGFELVKPLIVEVINKAFGIGPENAQTGPAIRSDYNTIDKHLNYLSEENGLSEIYKAITSDIIRTYED